MEKVLVEIYLPAANKTFEVYIPLAIRVNEAVLLVSNVLSDLSDGKFLAAEDTVLCDAVSGTILNINKSVFELGIQNGTKLILI